LKGLSRVIEMLQQDILSRSVWVSVFKGLRDEGQAMVRRCYSFIHFFAVLLIDT
jgi:endonuclease YncB( thermonuclease family)